MLSTYYFFCIEIYKRYKGNDFNKTYEALSRLKKIKNKHYLNPKI